MAAPDTTGKWSPWINGRQFERRIATLLRLRAPS